MGYVCPILSPRIKDNFLFAHFETGIKLTKNPIKTIRAINRSLPYLSSHNTIAKNNSQQTILLLSHFYNLWDDFIGKDIINNFLTCGFNIKTKEDLPNSVLKSSRGFAKNVRWVYERELYNAFQYCSDKVDGICNIISFGCGPDSLIGDIMNRQANEYKIPFLQLVIDEHTSKTGINTRIEAFSEIVKKHKMITQISA